MANLHFRCKFSLKVAGPSWSKSATSGFTFLAWEELPALRIIVARPQNCELATAALVLLL